MAIFRALLEVEYKLTYRKVAAPPNNTVVSYNYSVPRRGGLFEMRPGLVSMHPLLAKFPRVKMIARNMLHGFNHEQEFNRC